MSSANQTGADATWTVEVLSDTCFEYDILWDVVDCDADDAFEDNDTAAAPWPTIKRSGTGLRVHDGDDDYFRLGTVPAGQTVTLTVDFRHALGDIDADLEDLNGFDLPGLTGGAGVTDQEVVQWTNTTGASVDVLAHIFHFGFSTCLNNTYDFSVSTAP
ncbi:MAG: hypothetical protein H6734_21695 [Alphaproteobacteria bacterium]|nr:hypothetical protein [Alphaproteobacteria bacterium]